MLKPLRVLQEKATAYHRRDMIGIDRVTLPGDGFFSNFTRFLMENPPMTRKQAKEMLEPIVDHLIDQVRARRQTSMFLLTRLLTHPIARPCRSPPAA